MNCLIDHTVNYYLEKGKKLDVIKRYIRMKYRIHIDRNALRSRLENLRQKNVRIA